MKKLSVFGAVFGRRDKNREEHSPRSRSAWLMGPGSDLYYRSKEEGRKVFSQYPFEEWAVVSEDGLRLFARFCRCEGADRTAVLIHGHQSDGVRGYCDVGRTYLSRGWNILIPDNRACGRSEGGVTTFGVMESRDTALWLDELNRRLPGQTVALHGTSLGGAIVCLMAGGALPDNVRAVVSDCAFAYMRDELSHMLRAYLRLPCPLLMTYLEWRFRRRTGLRFADSAPAESVRRAVLPMLFIHGAEDRYVPLSACDQLFDACASPVRRRLTVGGAGHAGSALKDPALYAETLFGFLDEFAPAPEP